MAVLFPPTFTESFTVKKSSYQMAAVSCKDLTVINLYRSANANTEELILDFLALVQDFDGQQTIVLCGDFNFCEREEAFHPIRTMLLDNQFVSLFPTPVASHMEGRCLDQAYVKNIEETLLHCSASIGTSSFSDHDPVFVDITSQDGRE